MALYKCIIIIIIIKP